MTIAPYTDDKALLRNVFRSLYKLKEDIKGRKYEGVSMDYCLWECLMTLN